jgi:hypothetical protein
LIGSQKCVRGLCRLIYLDNCGAGAASVGEGVAEGCKHLNCAAMLLEPRLRPVVALLNQAMSALIRNGGKIASLEGLLGQHFDTQFMREYAGRILSFFGVCERRGSVRVLLIRARDAAQFNANRARLKKTILEKLRSLEV